MSEKITLIQRGPLPPRMESLGFKKTNMFNCLFSPEYPCSPPCSPAHNKTSTSVSAIRLGPIIRNPSGKRIDRELIIDANLLQKMKKLNLCSRHYLREDCAPKCKRNHLYPRPLSLEEHNAVWFLARASLCQSLKRNSNCNDGNCIYGHRYS